jgi:hypothetical protein
MLSAKRHCDNATIMNKTQSRHRRKQVRIEMEGGMQCDWNSSRMIEWDRVEWQRVEAHLIA